MTANPRAIHRRSGIHQVLYIFGSDFGQVLDEAVGIRQQAVAAPQEAARIFGSLKRTKATK